jgi:hypothetical protein
MFYLIKKVLHFLSNHVLPVKLVVAQQKVIARFNKTLGENQACNNNVFLFGI